MNILFSDRYRYFIYRSGCDMRKGYDGLSGLVRNEWKKDPLSGDVFIFLSKQRNKIKLLHWQSDGFVIYSKRLERELLNYQKIIRSKLLLINCNLFWMEFIFHRLKKESDMSIILLVKYQ